jgi:hypothetical protein
MDMVSDFMVENSSQGKVAYERNSQVPRSHSLQNVIDV